MISLQFRDYGPMHACFRDWGGIWRREQGLGGSICLILYTMTKQGNVRIHCHVTTHNSALGHGRCLSSDR